MADAASSKNDDESFPDARLVDFYLYRNVSNNHM